MTQALSSGDLRMVAFTTGNGLQELNSRDSLHSQAHLAFADQIQIPKITDEQLAEMLTKYVSTLLPNRTLSDSDRSYLGIMGNYYQPNFDEPKRSISILEFIRRKNGSGPITMLEIAKATASIANVPMWLINRDFTRIKALEQKLDEQIVGVKAGKNDVMTLAQKGYVAGRADGKPVANMLLAGPTGTGKTFLAEKFAELMEMPLVVFDMTHYQSPLNFDRFVETLSAELQKNPFGIFLFEEIDKADVQVLDRLYMLMDKGIFNDLDQKPLFARGIFVMMTTNAAQYDILQNKDAPNLQEIAMTSLMETFRPSFINRFDRVTVFKPFSEEENRQLAVILSKQIAKNIRKRYAIELTIDAATYEYIAKNGQDPIMGARPMERLVAEIVETGLSDFALQHGDVPMQKKVSISRNTAGEHSFVISCEGKQINFALRR